MKTKSVLVTMVTLSAFLAGCGSSGPESSSSSVVVTGGVPIAYAKRINTIQTNPTNGAPTAPGGDLMVRELSSASAVEHNITGAITQGHGDVNSLDVSYDGQKIVFAMNCPTTNTSTINGQPACTGRFNIWEYDMSSGGIAGGTLRRITSSGSSDDVEPTYLPGGAGIVFSSNRQTESSQHQALGYSYFALDEYERERVFNLHTMALDGSKITQISFNQSHDRSPVVRPNGTIMFSRWDHVGGRNHFKVFTVNPDGTGLFVLYGSHSDGVAFLHPRDMDPNGQYNGYLTSDLMPLSRTFEGGAVMLINAQNFTDENSPATSATTSGTGQVQATAQALNYNMGLSQYGRITTPYPLWDGTNRVLLSYTPCMVNNAGVEVSCATLSQTELTALENPNRLISQATADPVKDTVNPDYAIYMFDPAAQTMLLVASPPAGYVYTHPVALMARTEPVVIESFTPDPTAPAGYGVLDVRSVYDTDALGRMSASVLAPSDYPSGCTTAIAQTTPADSLDTRPLVADLMHIKDPASAAYLCAPAKILRVMRAVAPPTDVTGERTAIGETDFEMQQILGYAPIQPDGSFKIYVPADTPIALAVIDAQGRAFQTHTNWIQVRPGETRTCDGCHSPRRGAAINSGAIVNYVPNAWLTSWQQAHATGETMADTLTRTYPANLTLSATPSYTDVWADTTRGYQQKTAVNLPYTGLPYTQTGTPGWPVNGIINYPQHIQPLWSATRTGLGGTYTCIQCHYNGSSTSSLDLTQNLTGYGRYASYDALMIAPPLLNSSGQPILTVDDGIAEVTPGYALVDTAASESMALGLARKSRLMEIMTGQTLMSTTDAQTAHPTPVSPDHSQMLNASEIRLLAEWMDTGGKYLNDPFAAGGSIQLVNGLNQTTFENQVYPIILANCAASCHLAVGSTATGMPAGTSFTNNRFVLTGDPTGDYNVTLTMITDTCNPASNYLLSKPSTLPHPTGAVGQTAAILPVGSGNYNAIQSWIYSGCVH